MTHEAMGLVAEEIARLVMERLSAIATPTICEYMPTDTAATYLSLSPYQLEIWRSQGAGPPYIKLSRLVRYKRSDLDEWMTARRQSHTAQNR